VEFAETAAGLKMALPSPFHHLRLIKARVGLPQTKLLVSTGLRYISFVFCGVYVLFGAVFQERIERVDPGFINSRRERVVVLIFLSLLEKIRIATSLGCRRVN
jgi:hypothetical protein